MGQIYNLHYTADPKVWKEVNLPEVYFNNLTSVAYGNGIFVAVASDSDNTAYSSDGINWAEGGSMPLSAYWNSITYGLGKFVAVGYTSSDEGKAAYSTDGETWTLGNITDGDWNSVTYGAGKFVAVGHQSDKGKAAWSADGINWEEGGTMPLDYRDWSSVAYGAGKFVAVGLNKNTAWSIDGTNWKREVLPSVTNWRSVTYGAGRFVAVGNNGGAYSLDGIKWEEGTMPLSAYWNSITYGAGKFVAVGYYNNDDDGIASDLLVNKAAYSTDGINWEVGGTMTPHDPDYRAWLSVAYGAGRFVAVGKNKAAYSEIRSIKDLVEEIASKG